MKAYHDELLAFVRAYTAARDGQMTLTRLGGTTYPDPAKTSWNDAVQWDVRLTFGRGYFVGAVVKFTGRWATPHPTAADPEGYAYAEMDRNLPAAEAVAEFLSPAIPNWVAPANPD